MKVLQTIGRHKSKSQEGIFQYRRTVDGVEIDMTVGQSNVTNPKFTVTTKEWQSILAALSTEKTLRLNKTKTSNNDPPTTSLHSVIDNAVPGKSWTDSHRASICAVLEHEGSIDHFGGVTGPIVLSADCSS